MTTWSSPDLSRSISVWLRLLLAGILLVLLSDPVIFELSRPVTPHAANLAENVLRRWLFVSGVVCSLRARRVLLLGGLSFRPVLDPVVIQLIRVLIIGPRGAA